MKLTKYDVEHMARGYLMYELARRELHVTTFSDNVPDFDRIVNDSAISVCFRHCFEEMQGGSILCS